MGTGGQGVPHPDLPHQDLTLHGSLSQGAQGAPAQLGLGAASALRAGSAPEPSITPKNQCSSRTVPPSTGDAEALRLWSHPMLTRPRPSILPPCWQQGWASLGKDPPKPLAWGQGQCPWTGSCCTAGAPPIAAPPAALHCQCLPRAAAAYSCVGEDFPPPLPEGAGTCLQIKWKWGIQRLQSPAAASIPPSLPALFPCSCPQHLPRVRRCPQGHASPRHVPPRSPPGHSPARCQ